MKATLVETNRWCPYQRLRGFVLDDDRGRLPGMININLDNIEASIASELKRYQTDYSFVEVFEDGSRVLHTGCWAPVDPAEVESAIRSVI